MKQPEISKTLRKHLGRKKQSKSARSLEKKIKSSLLSDARKLSKELASVEQELKALPEHVSCHWFWLADIKRACSLMDQVLEVLEDARASSSTSEPAQPAEPTLWSVADDEPSPHLKLSNAS